MGPWFKVKRNKWTLIGIEWREANLLYKSRAWRCLLSIDNWVPRSGMLLYLHLISNKIFFHPAKFDNFKDETISDYKTVSVPQSQILAGLKTGGLVGLWATFEGSFFYVFWGKKLHKIRIIIFFFPKFNVLYSCFQ